MGGDEVMKKVCPIIQCCMVKLTFYSNIEPGSFTKLRFEAPDPEIVFADWHAIVRVIRGRV